MARCESGVFFLLGRVYKKLNQPGAAMVHFTNAIDLKPSSADVSLIKAAMESLSTADGAELSDDDAWGGRG